MLDLSRNAIGASGAKLIASGLAESVLQLQSLSLEDCDIRDVGYAAVIKGIAASKSVRTLQTLDVARNSLKDGTLTASALTSLPSLQHFDASWNQYDPEAGVSVLDHPGYFWGAIVHRVLCVTLQAYIAQALIGNTSLLSLSLQFNSFDDATGAAFLRVCTAGSETTTKRPLPPKPRPPKTKDKKTAAPPKRDKKGPPPVKRIPSKAPHGFCNFNCCCCCCS